MKKFYCGKHLKKVHPEKACQVCMTCPHLLGSGKRGRNSFRRYS